MEISQAGYIEKVLERFEIWNCQPVSTPCNVNQHLCIADPGTEIDNITHYQFLIGSLMYTVIGTRPDLTYITTSLFQYNSSTNKEYLIIAK